MTTYDRLRDFEKALSAMIYGMELKTFGEYNAIAKILESRALYLRYRADELLSDDAEVPTKE